MSVYLRKSASSPYYYYDFELKGRRFQGSTGFKSRRAAEAHERGQRTKAAEEIKRGLAHPADNNTVDEVFARYWEAYGHKLDWAPSLVTHMNDALEVLGAGTPVQTITNKDIAAVLDAYAETGVSNATINLRLAAMRQIFNKARDVWEIETGRIDWKRHKRAGSDPRVRHITAEQAKGVIRRLPQHIQLMVAWSLTTGCRLGETDSLRWSRINWDTHIAEVETKGRGKKTRYINLGPDALTILELCDPSREYVFDNKNRRKHWERAVREAGLEDFRWHDLRHTFATWLGQAGAGLQVVQKALGHTKIDTTMKYLHVIRSDVESAVSKLPTMMEGTVVPLKAVERK